MRTAACIVVPMISSMGGFERLPLKYAHGTELQELYPGQ